MGRPYDKCVSIDADTPHLHRGRYQPRHDCGHECLVTLCLAGPIAEDAGAAEHVEAAEASMCGLQVFRCAAERDHTHPHQQFRGQLRAAQPAASQRGARGARIQGQ